MSASLDGIDYKATKQLLADAQRQQALAEAKHHAALAAQAEKATKNADALHALTVNIMEAEARKSIAEAEEAEVTLEVGKLALEHSKLTMTRERRLESEEMARTRHHFVYDLVDTPVVASGGTYSYPAISDLLVSQCIEELGRWHRSSPEQREFEVILNSEGGDINAGFVLVDYLRWLRDQGHVITVRVLGMAASMGAVVLQAADRRIMGKHSVMLLHKASFQAKGDYDKVKSTIGLVDIYHERILDLLEERSSLTRKTIKTNFDKGDWWMSAADALKRGFVDELA